MSSRLRKQSRLLCGHYDGYLSRAAFWKHRKAYYDVHRERWITKTEVEHLELRAKRPKPCQDHESRGEMWASGSSGDEDLEAVKSTQGMSYSNFNQKITRNKVLSIWGSSIVPAFLCELDKWSFLIARSFDMKSHVWFQTLEDTWKN